MENKSSSNTERIPCRSSMLLAKTKAKAKTANAEKNKDDKKVSEYRRNYPP